MRARTVAGRRTRRMIGALSLLCASGCDLSFYALMNSIPTDSDASGDVHVLLGIDSLAESALIEARARGAFAEKDWNFSKVATVFPGTSDVSWTRLMHTERIESYEYQYYNQDEGKLVRSGYWGLFTHAVPWLEKPCYEVFDFSGNGLTNLYYMYAEPWYSLENSLDNTFILLDGRASSDGGPVFMSYMNEVDAMGHMLPREESIKALLEIDRRIRDFKKRHKERTFRFTLLSDHGQNFIPCREASCLIRFQDHMPGLGINRVEKLSTSGDALEAVPIVHTRVNYLSLHTRADQAEEVARRASTPEFADFTVSRVAAPAEYPEGSLFDWFGLFKGGARILRFGHDPETDTYHVDEASDFAALDLPASGTGSPFGVYTDEQLFALSRDRTYPDLFYRVRTGLSQTGIKYPAQVLLSFKHPYASIGFEIPGNANAIAAESFHGGMHQLDSFGVILTEEQELPSVVRGDTVLEQLPMFRDHVMERGAYAGPDDDNEELDYEAVEAIAETPK